MTTVKSLRARARTYYYYTLGLRDVVGIAQEELHTVLFGHGNHLVGKFPDVIVGNQSYFDNVDAFPFGSGAGGGHHLSGHVEYVFVAAVTFVLYHNLLSVELISLGQR